MHRIRFAQITFGAVMSLAAAAAFSDPPPIVVQEIPQGGGLEELKIINQSNLTSTPFDAVYLVITSNGVNPATTNSNWTTQQLPSSILWNASMDLNSGFPSWSQYTSAPYPAAPPDPCLGFYLNYIFDSTTGDVTVPADPCRPGTVLGQFFFQDSIFGASENLTFLVGGPTNASIPYPLGDVQNFSAAVQMIPEPSGCMLLLISGAGLLHRARIRPIRLAHGG